MELSGKLVVVGRLGFWYNSRTSSDTGGGAQRVKVEKRVLMRINFDK